MKRVIIVMKGVLSMKKVILFFLFLSLIYIHGSVHADYDGEILFRNHPWLCNLEVIINELESATGDSLEISMDYNIEPWSYWGDSSMFDYIENGGFQASNTSLSGQFFVGGHSVKEVYANAMYGIINGAASTELKDSQFYKAAYCFNFTQETGEEIYNDLLSKLKSIYGEPFSDTIHFSTTTTFYKASWKGLNKTGLHLRYETGLLNNLYLIYGRTDTSVLFANLSRAIFLKDENSLDGL